MAIEFRCSQCNQLLRVSDGSAGKNARCPKCQTLMTVPAASSAGQPPAPPPPPPFPAAAGRVPAPPVPAPAPPPAFAPPPPPVPQPEDPFAFLNKPGTKSSGAPGGNPFAASANPYAAPAGGYEAQSRAIPGGPLTNVQVSLDPIMSHAWRIWQNNLGLLVGVTVIAAVISNAVALPLQFIQGALAQNNQPEAALVVALLGFIANVIVAIFLGIGQVQVALKLARGQRAQIGDLFGGGERFLPVLGASLLASVALFFGFSACIVPGILLLLWFWPFYYLVVDDKSGVIDSISLAAKITERNRATAFVLWLVSFGIILLGLLACCIGVLLAAPLVSVLWATAYLMMSGQLSPQPQLAPKY